MSAAFRVGQVARRSRGFWPAAGVRLWNDFWQELFDEPCLSHWHTPQTNRLVHLTIVFELSPGLKQRRHRFFLF
jgi:hypothetical protein